MMTQSQVDQWNERHPPGTHCSVKYDDGTWHDHVIRSEAWLLGGGQAVVKVNGKAGGYSLDRVATYLEDEP